MPAVLLQAKLQLWCSEAAFATPRATLVLATLQAQQALSEVSAVSELPALDTLVQPGPETVPVQQALQGETLPPGLRVARTLLEHAALRALPAPVPGMDARELPALAAPQIVPFLTAAPLGHAPAVPRSV